MLNVTWFKVPCHK